MRIGVYIQSINKEVGGGFTFVRGILESLPELKGGHEFIIFNKSGIEQKNDAISYVSIAKQEKSIEKQLKKHSFFKKIICKIQPFKNLYFEIEQLQRKNHQLQHTLNQALLKYKRFSDTNNALNLAASQYNIELMWFPSPDYMPVDCPYIYTVWDLAHRNYPFFPEVNYTGWIWNEREALYQYAIRKATFVITGTNNGKDEIIKYYNVSEDRIRVIPFFAYVKNTVSNEFIPKIRPYILYPAQFWPHKNHITVIKAILVLREKYDFDLDFVFTGSDKGNKKYIESVIEKYGLSENAHLKGFVSDEELIRLYKNAFALVFPTYFGPDNLPPLEAMSYSLPVIASDIHKDQLADAALYFEPQNYNDLANLIKLLFEDDNLKKELILKGHELMKNRTPSKYVNKIVEIINQFYAIRTCWSNTATYLHL